MQPLRSIGQVAAVAAGLDAGAEAADLLLQLLDVLLGLHHGMAGRFGGKVRGAGVLLADCPAGLKPRKLLFLKIALFLHRPRILQRGLGRFAVHLQEAEAGSAVLARGGRQALLQLGQPGQLPPAPEIRDWR